MTYYETTVQLSTAFNFKRTFVKYTEGEPDLDKIKSEALEDAEGISPLYPYLVDSVFTRKITEEEYLEGIKKK